MLEDFIKVFVALFVIMDPFASIPAFISITKKASEKERATAATTAAGVAGGALVIFIIFGPALLDLLHITIQDFEIAGGVLLFLMAIQFAFGLDSESAKSKDVSVAVVVIAVPLITGPGAMTTAIILAAQTSTLLVIAAALLATVVTWLILRNSGRIIKIIGNRGVSIFSRMAGLLLAGIAVGIIRSGLGL